MWLLLIIVLTIISIYLSFKIKFRNYKIKISSDKSGMLISLSTKVGVGSIIGTVSSVIIGGFSSVIWIIVFSFLSTSLTYYEALLGNKYKSNINGVYSVIRNGLNNKYLAIFSSIVFVILYPFIFGMIQVNTISNLLSNVFLVNKYYILIYLLVFLLLVIFIKKEEITKIIYTISPLKCVFFIIFSIVCILFNYNELIYSINYLIKNIFSFRSMFTGFVIGIKRSIFMNEILIGTTSFSSGYDIDINSSINNQILSTYIITLTNTILVTCMMLIYSNNHILVGDYNTIIVSLYNYILPNGVFIMLLMFILFTIGTLLSGYLILSNYVSSVIIKVLYIAFLSTSVFINSDNIWLVCDIFIFIMIIINTYSIIKLRDVDYDR